MNKYCLIILLCFVAAVTKAQERKISGTLTDRDTHEPVTQTTVQLLKSDSTFVVGAISNEKGEFALSARRWQLPAQNIECGLYHLF